MGTLEAVPSVEGERRALLSALETLLVEQTVELTQIATTTLGDGLGNRAIEGLLAVHSQPGITPSALADRLGVARSAMARALRDLEDQGLLARSSDRDDRRVMHLEATPAGLRRVTAFERELVRYFGREAPGVLELLRSLTIEPTEPLAPALGRVPPLAVSAALARVGGRYEQDVQAALTPFGVSHDTSQYTISLLREYGELRPVELALRLRLTTAGVSQLVDRLEAVGVVRRRQPSRGDGRSVLVALTDRGELASAVMLDVLDRHVSALCSAYSLAVRVDRVVGAA